MKNTKKQRLNRLYGNIVHKSLYAFLLSPLPMLATPMDMESKVVLETVQVQETVTGLVTDSNGEPLVGVTIKIKGKSDGTVTDIDGKYSLSNVSKGDILHFSFVGMASQEIKIGTKKNINVVLKEDAVGLEEVVAIGYTSMKRKDLSGSVASISAEKINRIPANDITTALVGVPGIRMDGSSIRIRGTRSKNASNDPLIVLDGIPYNETLASINPGDIESIDVLKDAASTAIYGAKGANGVILITTRQAKKGKTVVSYDGFAGVGVNNWGSFDVMDADEYIAFKREAYRAAGTWKSEADDPKAFAGSELSNMGKMNTKWVDDYFKQKLFWTNHLVTIASANDKTSYKISFNYKNEDNAYKNAGADHFYLTTDLSHQVLPFLKVGLSNRAYYTNKRSKPDMFETFIHMSPLTPVRNEDGSYNEYPLGDPFVKNPYLNESDDVYKDQTKEWKIFLRLYAELKLAKNLTYNTNFAYTPAFSSKGYYYDNRSVSYMDDLNVAGTENNRQNDWVWNNILNYKLQLKQHTIDLTGVFEMQNREYVGNSMSGKDQESPAYLWYNMGRLKESKTLSTGFTRSSMISYIARVQYDYADKYIVSASIREDGASQLSKGQKWAFFPSMSAAWRISEEEFIKNIDWISNLKLRASYGMTGNYSIAPYATTGGLWGTYANFRTDSEEIHRPGLEPDTRPTPDLEWEKNKMLNIALDFSFCHDLLHGSVEWYDSKSYDLLYLKTLPYTTGFNRAWDNVGDTRNRGIEASLTVSPFRQKDLGLDITLSYYKNKEELVRLQDPKMTEDINNGLFVGYPVSGVYYDYKQVGIWQEEDRALAEKYGQVPGEVRVEDLDNNGKIDGDDRMILGTNRPDWVGGLQVSGYWKKLDFSVDCYGEFGALMQDSYSTSFWASEMGRWNTVKIDYWTPEHPSNRHPRPVAGQSIKYLGATGYYKNNYLTVRNITLGYTLPSFDERIKKLRLYVTVNDPIRYHRVQHDGGISWWTTYYLFGVNLQF